MRLTITRRSAPAISTPRLKALFTTARNVNRTKAMAKDPTVKMRRIFLRKRLAKMSRPNFMPHLPLEHFHGKKPCPQQARLSQGAKWCGRVRQQPDRE